MVRVIGIDPGTKSFDLCGLDDEKIILDVSISTKDINKEPAAAFKYHNRNKS